MKIPTVKGFIRRRILANYVADVDVIQNILPNGFRPKLYKHKAVVGICLIRLENIRPKFMPEFLGLSSENAAHRIAVEWNENGETMEGVYVPRRDTDSSINAAIGGTLFSGEYHKAHFEIKEKSGKMSYSMLSDDAEVSINFSGEVTDNLPETSIFATNQEASDFFELGSLGYSSRKNSTDFDGILLEIENWQVTPFEMRFVHSSYFEDENVFPKNSIKFDHALFMENIAHEWHSAPIFQQNGFAKTVSA
jgi:Uncharacterized conserved protein (COG2071)